MRLIDSIVAAGCIVLSALFTVVQGVGIADAQNPPLPKVGVTALFPAGDEVAAYDADEKILKFLALRNGTLSETKRFTVPGNVWGVATLPDGYAIATGLGRGDLEAPMRVQWYSKNGKSTVSIFERTGERSQVSYLNFADGKLWITFFDSKYITKTGYFTQNPDASWTYKELFSVRLGDSVGVLRDTLVVGRPYGDVQGQDGDLRLYKGEASEELPSYRGVRAVRLFGDAAAPSIAIGDGWHQNYAQFAQGRLSLLQKDPVTGRYALQLLDHDSSQYGFSKIVDFTLDGKTYLAALGNKSLCVYGPSGTWKKNVLYTRAAEDAMYDVVYLRSENGKAWFVLLDKEVKIVSFPAA
jgi:hypothetical protein